MLLYLKLRLSRWEGRGLPLPYALNGDKGNFGKCFVTSFISYLVFCVCLFVF